MVNLEWTPRLEKAFRKLQTQTDNSSITTTSQEKKTLNDAKALLSEKAPTCVDMELVKQVSALLLKNHSSETNEGIP